MIGRSEEYEKMFRLEGRLWWYRALHDRVLAVLQANFTDRSNLAILDVGCGTGGLLAVLQQQGYKSLAGLDGSADAVRFCRQRGFAVTFIDLTRLDTLGSQTQYDVIICNDVLCYIPEPDLPVLLIRLAQLLKPGGLFISNNNAFDVFRGQHDIAVGIGRRFMLSDFDAIMPASGLPIRTATYWSFVLSPVILLMRQWQNVQLRMGWRTAEDAQSDVYLPANWLNEALYRIVRVEQRLFSRTPFGSSLFITARRK